MANTRQQFVKNETISGSDQWLLDNVEMEVEEERKPKISGDAGKMVKQSAKVQNLKNEAHESKFGSDQWLLDSVKMEEEDKEDKLQILSNASKGKIKTMMPLLVKQEQGEVNMQSMSKDNTREKVISDSETIGKKLLKMLLSVTKWKTCAITNAPSVKRFANPRGIFDII